MLLMQFWSKHSFGQRSRKTIKTYVLCKQSNVRSKDKVHQGQAADIIFGNGNLKTQTLLPSTRHHGVDQLSSTFNNDSIKTPRKG